MISGNIESETNDRYFLVISQQVITWNENIWISDLKVDMIALLC